MRNSRPFDRKISFESYGVRFTIEASDAELLEKAERTARKALVNRLRIIDSKVPENTFRFSSDGDNLFLFQDGEQISTDAIDGEHRFFRYFNSILRIFVAEHARDTVFIHAGVVGWKGKAIVIPASSFAGKTTLVAELVKNGAEYYSDEYAVLDDEGLVHPFPRDLSVRDAEFTPYDVSVEELGGKIGSKPIPVGTVLITSYDEGATWDPRRLTVGRGMLEVIPHTIPRNLNAEFSLKVLNTALKDAIILQGFRGEARYFAARFLSLFDDIASLNKIT